MSLVSLSQDCLSYLLSNCQLSASDLANIRATARSLRHAVDANIHELRPSTGSATDISVLLGKLPALTDLFLGSSCGVTTGVTNYTRLADYVAPLAAQLASHSSLTSLSFSTADLQQLGSLKWAHKLCAQQQDGNAIRKWYKDEYAEFAADSQHQVYWLPDWLASPPGLQKLIIQPPRNGSPYYCTSPKVPACLWFNPKVWSTKLKHLELRAVPLNGHMPPGLSQLTQLHNLGVIICCLQPDAVAQLLLQLAKGQIKLKVLTLNSNDLWQLPSLGWQALESLQELDLSNNLLVDLPLGLSHLTSLTSLQLQHNQLNGLPLHLSALQQLALLDVSHNWLSGFTTTPHIGQLIASWPQLQVLRVANVSDKRGALTLPAELGKCSRLAEVRVAHNYSVDWRSLEALLDKCQGLQVVDLSGTPATSVAPSFMNKLDRLKHQVKTTGDNN